MNTLQDIKAILILLSLPMPGQRRQDKDMTSRVQLDHGLGGDSGKWSRQLWPGEALAPIKALNDKIREYHHKVTRPFSLVVDEDGEDQGLGQRLLTGPLVIEHTEQMGKFKVEREKLVESHFFGQWDKWVEWAKHQHNGTFNELDYVQAKVAKKFKFILTTAPIPESAQFSEEMKELLGTDAESIDRRMNEVVREAQLELVNRLAEPVRDMVSQLAQCPQPNSTVLVRLKEIVELAPKLDLCGDPQISLFVKEMRSLLVPTLDNLRALKPLRTVVRGEAERMLAKLDGYSLKAGVQ